MEAPKPYFSRLFGAHTLAMRKQPESHFVLEKAIRNASRPSSGRCKKQAKFDSDACRTELSAKIALQTRLGARSARFWRSLGLSWVALGRHLAGFWELLGGSWPVLDTSQTILGRSWPSLGCFGTLLGCILPPGASSGIDFKRFRDVQGLVWEGFGCMFWHAFCCAWNFITKCFY